MKREKNLPLSLLFSKLKWGTYFFRARQTNHGKSPILCHKIIFSVPFSCKRQFYLVSILNQHILKLFMCTAKKGQSLNINLNILQSYIYDKNAFYTRTIKAKRKCIPSPLLKVQISDLCIF